MSNSHPSTRRSASAASNAAAAEASSHPSSSSSIPATRSSSNDKRPRDTSHGVLTIASVPDCESFAAKLIDPASDVKTKLSIATELRESVEQFRDVDYAKYLSILLPAFTDVLRNGTPVFGKHMVEQKLRHTLLEIIQRLPHNDHLKPYADGLMELMLHLLRVENEENGVVCIKIVIDQNRTFKSDTEKHVGEFLDLVKEMYRNLKEVVRSEFGVEGEEPDPPKEDDPSKNLRASLRSFKVLTECPIAVVLVFQSYREAVYPRIREFFPLVMECLTLQAEPQRRAYAEAAERGELFVGVAEGLQNRELYSEFVVTQVKTMSFIAYVLRTATDEIRKHSEAMAAASIRLLRDCPPEAVPSRKELLVATRHILSTDFKMMYVSQIDIMLDERVLVGTGITSQEALRPLAYSMLADLVHHVRDKLSVPQLCRVVHIYACCLHEPAFTFGIQTMCAKLLLNLIETICTKTEKTESPKFLMTILESCIDKLVAVEAIHGRLREVHTRSKKEKEEKGGEKEEKEKGEEKEEKGEEGDRGKGKGKDDRGKAKTIPEWLLIEKGKPVHAVSYASEGTDSLGREPFFLQDAKYLVKTLLHGVRALLSQLRTMGAPPPDGNLLGKLFEAEFRLISHYDPLKDMRDEKEALELFVQILLQFDPHVFAEVWTTKMDFFVEQCHINPHILNIPQSLLVPQNPTLTHLQDVSHQLVAIMLKDLMSKLESFGEQDKKESPLTLKLFKLAFMAVNSSPEHNESVLVPHLASLITDSFSYAAKASEPTIYYAILRALFRSIGGGRFEALYKEVLPILQEMLDTLNYLLLHAEPDKRDLFVELCLTVPVRLTNLLPHLGYLMKPLVHALRAGPELVSQGLRTLELCIDNLTSEFLDPTLGPVLRDLMAALHDLLKPVPFNHHHAHSTVKILGKLGGRNRRFQSIPHLLEYEIPAVETVMPISFDGNNRELAVSSVIALAVKTVQDPKPFYREQATTYLRQSALMFSEKGIVGTQQESVFQQTVLGLFLSTLSSESKEPSTEFIRQLSQHIFAAELARNPPVDVARHSRDGRSPPLSVLTSSYLEAVSLALADFPTASAKEGEVLVSLVVDDILGEMAKVPSGGSEEKPEAPILDALGSKFSSLCFEEPWKRKLAGCTGIHVLTSKPGLGVRWIIDRQLDFLRPLLFILKDMPNDPPRTVSFIIDVITEILRLCNGDTSLGVPQRAKVVQTLIRELASTNPVVRETAQSSIALLAELTSTSVPDLLSPVANASLLTPIFDKPLRALPFAMQIGNLEAVTYCLNLRPSLPEVNEQLVRLLSEAIALADAEDQALIGRAPQHRHEVSLRNLRISCLRLLSAAMACTDFFAKQSNVRSRIIAVYFKHVYSPTKEIMSVAHQGLKNVLAFQSKLPKEILQSGLRPILVNLADAKRLSVSGLEGLARFLELLTNYFKVEIGHKLLDHFRTLSEEQGLLAAAAFSPLEDNPDIARMVRLINVFRLLPSTANMFLKTLTTLVVEAETHLHQSAPGPFTENLAMYLDRYKGDAISFLFENLRNPDIVRTYRNVIASGKAPDFVAELSAEASKLGKICFTDEASSDLVSPGLLLVRELIQQDPTWLKSHSSVLDSLLALWRASPSRLATSGSGLAPSPSQKEPLLIVDMFISYLRCEQHVPLLFDIIRIYTLGTSTDLSAITSFLHAEIAVNAPTTFKRKILDHFLGVFGDSNVGWDFKMHALRLLVNPILVVFFSQDKPSTDLIDTTFAQSAQAVIWSRVVHDEPYLASAGDALKIELLQMSTLLTQHCSESISDVRKDIIKMAWVYIKDPDPTVKHTAYLLIARFIEANDCPANIIMQVWTGLVKLPPLEGRVLVRRAIDIVAPIIPSRIPHSTNGPQPWVTTVRKVLTEEGHNTPHLISAFELIVGHPDLFYESRELFVPQMVNSLARLGSTNSATPEMKKLSIDIVNLIVTWEKRRTGITPAKDDLEPGKRSSDGELPSPKRSRIDRAGTAVSTSSGGGWSPAGPLRETIVSFLIRFVSASAEPISANELVKRAFELLKELLVPTPWSAVTVKLPFFSRLLTAQNEVDDAHGSISNSVKVLALVVASSKPESFLSTQFGLLHKLIERSVVSDQSPLHTSVQPILERMFEATVPSTDGSGLPVDVKAFESWAEKTVTDGLNNEGPKPGLKSTLFILGCWAKARPEKIESLFATPLVKILNKLAKEHLTFPVHPQALPSSAFESNTDLVMSALRLCRIRVADLKDQRRWLLSALVQLIERSTSARLCHFLLEIMRDWVLSPTESVPTQKEKAGLLLKMTAYEKKDDPTLFTSFLQLIYDIYTQPSLKRTDLTTRLEPAFLLGTRTTDPELRSRFIDLFNSNLPRSMAGRLQYILASQSWESLSSSYWIQQAIDLLLGCVDAEELLFPSSSSSKSESPLRALIQKAQVKDYLLPVRRLLHTDPSTAHILWISVFTTVWSTLSKAQQAESTRHLVSLLAKEHHLNQVDMRPNIVQSILEGILASSPAIVLPPFVVKYLGKTFEAWHTAIELMDRSLSLEPIRSDEALKDNTRDGLAELYADLCEDDLFYGLWRRRSIYAETNAALSYEQNGLWPQAEVMYETAQIKARTGVLPFTEPEYCLWEDHWILAAQKLQQWDILTDLAKAENNHDLLLECAWRLSDWGSMDRDMIDSTLAAVSDVATPRRKVFEAYTCLLKSQNSMEKNADFAKILDEAFQLSIRKWVSLPKAITMAHIPLLQLFQQYVELSEAALVFDSLAMTNAQNLEFRVAHDLKGIFTTWRERLPNFWDDISVWSDLLAWRQHVFSAVTKVYVPLIAPGETATYGYRGYHETAWMINRFGHVARKHQLHDVCSNALNKIYALPNIEISEAFLKLREQAMCHYQKTSSLAEGLESISTTNLMYFAPGQKAEFLTLKGMFIAKLGHVDDANHAFAQAVQMDLNLPKAWAEWGHYNDQLFKEKPTEQSYAANAVSCYLQAAGLYKSRKTRKLLVRVLWLLSLDDPTSTSIFRAFDDYQGETPVWYWITLVPQLLLSLSHRESKQAHVILNKIAKSYPQGLFYQLRTSKEDFAVVKRQHQAHLAKQASRQSVDPSASSQTDSDANVKAESSADGSTPNPSDPPAAQPNLPLPLPQPWERVEDILNMLKTAVPLLALSMEKMVDQIQTRGKPPPEEDIYRFITALLMDGMQQYITRSDKADDDGKLSASTKESVTRFAQGVTNLSASLRANLEEDLIKETSLRDYVRKLQRWRDKYENSLDSRPRKQPLDQANCYLSEFHHGKFDEVEIPGQYLQHVDSNNDFARIARFSPTVELGRGHGFCLRRITMIGHTGVSHSFTVQLPAARHTRREDRVAQLFRMLSTALQTKKESRKRNLAFHLPAAIPLAPSLRLIELDSTYISLQDVFDAHCKSRGLSKEDPILYFADRFRELFDPKTSAVNSPEWLQLRLELLDELEAKFIPKTILSDYMVRLMKTPQDLFLMRKSFTLNIASVSFITYVAALQQRNLARFNVSTASGQIYMSELLPSFKVDQDGQPVLYSGDPVDFRLTPNIQTFIGPTAIEGLLTSSMCAIGRGLSEEFALEDSLSLWSRDECYHFLNSLKRRPLSDLEFRRLVELNVRTFSQRVRVVASSFEISKARVDVPLSLSVISLINRSTSKLNLAQLNPSYLASF